MIQTVAVGGLLVIPLPDGSKLVSSRSVPGGWHVIRAGTCDCPSWHHRGRCSHAEAVAVAATPLRLVKGGTEP